MSMPAVDDDLFYAETETAYDTEMWRRGPDGALALVNADPNDYVNLPLDAQGARGQFELSGMTPIYDYQSPQYGVQKKTRLEFRILKFPGFERLEGRRFTKSISWPLKNTSLNNEKSAMGTFLRKLVGRKFGKREEVRIRQFIGTTFVTGATVESSFDGQKIYSGVSFEGIELRKTVLSAQAKALADAGALAIANAGTSHTTGAPGAQIDADDDDGDPFADDAL
jgi:hypothetical protein